MDGSRTPREGGPSQSGDSESPFILLGTDGFVNLHRPVVALLLRILGGSAHGITIRQFPRHLVQGISSYPLGGTIMYLA